MIVLHQCEIKILHFDGYVEEIFLIFRKYTLKYLGVIGHHICKLSEEKENIK